MAFWSWRSGDALLFCGVLEDYPEVDDVVSFLCTAPRGSALYHDSGVEGGWDGCTVG